jgi:hypothetical protein
MSRRQALGVISNVASANSLNQLKPSNINKPNVLGNIKNENEPPPWSTKHQKMTNDSDFEIFQEDLSENKKQQQSVLHKFASKHGYNPDTNNKKHVEALSSAKRGDKENLMVKKEPVLFSNNDEEEDEQSVSERYAIEDHEEEQYEEEEETYTSEEEEDEEDDDDDDYSEKNAEEVEEEGISRLNIGALIDSSNGSNKKAKQSDINTSGELMNMMDSSSFNHHDLSSPMVLDDTIKFHSLLSNFEQTADVDEYANECEEEKEERLKLQAIAERESLLVNCLEYKDEILQYMRKMEQEFRPKSNYMKKQQDINSSMRSILVDWLVEVSEEYKLNVETLYLAVNYTDRFLSQMSVLRGKLQLVGTASMYIASKYEEISPPDVAEFVYITDDTYTKKQVLRMEHLLLKVLDFRMNTPTINCFLLHYLRFLKLNSNNNNCCINNNQGQESQSRVENLSRYLAELTLIDADTFLVYLPSQIAASAVYLSMYTTNKPWTKQVADLLGYNYDLSELKGCIIDMHKCMQQAAQHPQQAIQEKYKHAKYDHVSLIEPPKALLQFIYQ